MRGIRHPCPWVWIGRRSSPWGTACGVPRTAQLRPRNLWKQLTAGHPVDELGSGQLFVALADLYREQTPSASVRAALLKLVATRSHVRDLGVLTDRAGRSGQALEVSSSQPGGLPARFVIIIDQSAGRLLSYEQTLTSDLGKLDVKIPAIIDYTLYR